MTRPVRLVLAGGVLAGLGLAIAGWTAWRAGSALKESSAEFRRSSTIEFTDKPLSPVALAGVELVSSSAVFRDAIPFRGSIWIISTDTLFEHAPDGALRSRHRVGQELPPAPLTKLAAGPMQGAAQPVLLIATQGEGLLVFDGSSFRQIRPVQPELRKITAILPLSTGQVLLGTEKAGVVVWAGGRLARHHESLNALPVTALAGGVDSLWVGTLDQGALNLQAGVAEKFSEGQGLPDKRVLSLEVSGDRAWVGTAFGIAEFTTRKFIRVIAEGTFAKSLLSNHEGLMVGTFEEGVVEIAAASRRPRQERVLRRSTSEVERLFTIDGAQAALYRDGLYVRPGGRGEWKPLITPESGMLTDNNIAALAAEPSGRVWIGYFDRGLDRLDPGANRTAHFEDEHLFCVNRIVPTAEGVAIATANGLVLGDMTGKPRQVLGRTDGLIANHITDVLVDPSGMVAATPAGITFLSRAGMRSVYAFHGLVNNHVYAMASAGGKTLAGTLGGVSVIENGTVKASYTTANSALRHNWVSALTRVGEEWFAGTYGAGVFRFDGTAWHGFPDLRDGFVVNPNAMAGTSTAVLAGSLDRGLAVFNRANGRWGFHTAGLPSLNVTAVAVDRGTVYAGTDNGLVRIQEGSLVLP